MPIANSAGVAALAVIVPAPATGGGWRKETAEVNKRWLVLLAPTGLLAGGVASASSSPQAPAPTPPPEEVELAQAQFDAAMAANAIDAATVRLVGCRADYSTAPNDPTIDVVSSICLGFVGGERGNPNNPPVLYGVNTIHQTDGTVFSFVFRYPGMAEGVGEPIPGTPTPVITIPEGLPAAAPTTTAAVPAGNDPNGIIARAQQYHGVTLTQDQVDCMIGIATDQGIGLETIGDPAGEAVPDGIRIFVEIAQACGAVIS
jgi:hypothetical protein